MNFVAKNRSELGNARRRIEDERLVTGRGTYVDDLNPPGCLHLEFLRSDRASGTLASLSTEAALNSPGVVDILTSHDVVGLPAMTVNPLLDDMTIPDVPLMTGERITAVGQPIAALVATTRAQAGDAIQLLSFEIEAGETQTDRVFEKTWATPDVDRIFSRAEHCVKVELHYPRIAPMAMEPRATLATCDVNTGELTVWMSTQTPHRARNELARILGIDLALLHVVAPDVGGSFGGKASLYPEDVIVALAAFRLRRPVKWCATRGEEFQSASHGRGARISGELAVASDGTFLALKSASQFPVGFRMPFSAVAPARNAGRILPGPYLIDSVDINISGFCAGGAPMNIYRGAGRPEATMLMERLADAAARATKLDPVEIRFRNLISSSQLPRRTPTDELLDLGDYKALLTTLVERSRYKSLRQQQDVIRTKGGIFGVGVAVYVEPCGAGWERAWVGLDTAGYIVAATGSTSQGQGRETAAAQIVAATLGVGFEQIKVRHGDTACTPEGIGALASRSTAIGGSALLEATKEFERRARKTAAHLLGVPIERVESDREGFRAVGDNATLTWCDIADVCRSADHDVLLKTEFTYEGGEAWASGAVLAAVSILAETGQINIESLVWIDDAGVVVNPMLVKGQLVGGLAQGLGEVLFERIVYDDRGQLVTGSLMDYGIMRASDMPDVEIVSQSVPSAMNPLGAKGVGEAGCIGAPAAIANAVIDALAPLGVDTVDIPYTNEKIWTAIKAAQSVRTEP